MLSVSMALFPAMHAKADAEFSFEYDNDSKTATLTKVYYADGLDVTIPSTVTDEWSGETYTVTKIGKQVFRYYSPVSVTIPETVTVIEDEAFYECNKFTSISIPESVTSIGAGAFYNCI